MKKAIGRTYSWLARLIRGYLLRDRFEREAARWFRDAGDSTLRVDYALDRNSIVLDCGGYKGDWAAEINRRYGSKVYVFEPVEEFYRAICKRFAGTTNVRVFPYGLHAKDEETVLNMQADGSSLFGTGGSQRIIQLRDVAVFLKEQGIPFVDLMKINIEGGEFDLLDRMLAAGLVSTVRNLQVQFHRFVPNAVARRVQIRERLEQSHRLTYDYEFIWENWELRR